MLKHPVIVAAISALLTVGAQQAAQQILRPAGPPPSSAVTALMDQEVQAAMTHDATLVTGIYDAQAVVMDAGCQSPSQGNVWSGPTSIMARYASLPQFASLAHTNPQITWAPNDASATAAYVSATTIGALAASAAGNSQPIRGHEQWVFAKSDSRWLIALFTYNLCLP